MFFPLTTIFHCGVYSRRGFLPTRDLAHNQFQAASNFATGQVPYANCRKLLLHYLYRSFFLHLRFSTNTAITGTANNLRLFTSQLKLFTTKLPTRVYILRFYAKGFGTSFTFLFLSVHSTVSINLLYTLLLYTCTGPTFQLVHID